IRCTRKGTGGSNPSLSASGSPCNKGEMPEWPKGYDWKSCVSKGTEGSNPSLSAVESCYKTYGSGRREAAELRQARKGATVGGLAGARSHLFFHKRAHELLGPCTQVPPADLRRDRRPGA